MGGHFQRAFDRPALSGGTALRSALEQFCREPDTQNLVAEVGAPVYTVSFMPDPAATSLSHPLVGSCVGWRGAPGSTSRSRHTRSDTPRSPPPWTPAAAFAMSRTSPPSDPPQTRRYDRARGALDRNPTYLVATYLAGATGAR